MSVETSVVTRIVEIAHARGAASALFVAGWKSA
jgi:hypothetical protein